MASRTSDGAPSAPGEPTHKLQSGEQAARRAESSRFGTGIARAGLGARAAVYLILAYLVAEIARTGHSGSQANSTGALEQVDHHPAGPALVVLLAGGLVAYAAWRFLQAAGGDSPADRGMESPADRGKELAKRAGWVGIGIVYLALCGRAIIIAAGGHSNGNSTFSDTRTVLRWPVGQPLLAAVGVGIVLGGLGLVVWAAQQRFMGSLQAGRMSGGLATLTRITGTFGNVVRGLAFAGIGASFFLAALVDQPSQAKGLDGTLLSVAGQPYGGALLLVVAAGLLAFAGYSVIELRYRTT